MPPASARSAQRPVATGPLSGLGFLGGFGGVGGFGGFWGFRGLGFRVRAHRPPFGFRVSGFWVLGV